ncbi:MAG: flagellar hook-associated protein FlgK [Alphaproteobacteria bacterium]|nr:flagellar hook-associated protein FlgK [Alphaproteobacteria bacterium]
MGLTSALRTGLSGLNASQKALSVVSENVANVNTEGYSRKVYSQQTIVLPDGSNSGVKANTNFRQVDDVIRKQYRIESGNMQKSYVRSYYLDLIQSKMGTVSSQQSLANRVNSIQTTFESLGIDADKLNSQSAAVSSLDIAIKTFNSLSNEIQSVRQEIDAGITDLCEEVNDILYQLDELNNDIVRTEAMNNMTSDDYRDKRDTLITRLSEIMDIQYYERSSGELVVLTKSGKSLLEKDPSSLDHKNAQQAGSLISYSGGGIPGLYCGEHDITNEIKSGELAGLIGLRDTELQDMQLEMDELAYQLKEALNSISNQGTNYPNMTFEIEGSRTFIDSSVQSITIGDDQDVKIVLFDEDGQEKFSTSLVSILGTRTTTIDNLTDTIQKWLQSGEGGPSLNFASCEIDRDGKFKLDLGTSTLSISFREENSIVFGSEQQLVDLSYNTDGSENNQSTRKFQGFCSFLGINDIILTSRKECVYDSSITSKAAAMGIKGTTTLSFSDDKYGFDFAEVTVTAQDTLVTIAQKINEACKNSANENIIDAQIVKEGKGYRLRIIDKEGNQLEINERNTTGVSLLNKLGIKTSHAGVANDIEVRPEILKSPTLLATGQCEYSTESGSYYLSESDNSLANKYCEVFSKAINFDSAGSFEKISTSLTKYANSIVDGLAGRVSDANASYSYQEDLVNTLYTKEQDISGVDLDEELSMMLLYQRSYSASAKVMSTSIEMLELLDSLF